MRKIFILLFVCSIVWLCKNGDSSSVVDQVDEKSEVSFGPAIDDLINKYQELDIFSGVVLIAEQGTPVYHKAFGLADRENNVKNTVNTLFDIGSMNKTFTSVVVKQLIQEGKLKYLDKLVDYVEGFEDPMVSEVTVEHLLNHESGFGDYHLDGYFNLPKSERVLWKIVDRVKHHRLLFPPGEEQEYSNTGYVLLGAIIEKVSGESYFDNVRKRIIKPLALENTYIQDLDRFSDRVAYGYLYSPMGVLEKNESLQDLPNPDGGFLSTTLDIMKFYRSYYYEDVLMDESMKAEDPFFETIRELAPGRAPLMAGGFEGFNSAFYQVLSNDCSIIVFANMDEPVAEQLALGILQITRGNEPTLPKLPALQNVRQAYEEKGIDFVKQNFDELTTNYHPNDPKDWILNDLGYAFIFARNDVDIALELFRLNTELFPDIGNVWDSYGEALVKKGQEKEALEAYRKALSINPDIPSANEAVKRLGNE